MPGAQERNATVSRALAHGTRFLLQKQGRDGLWRDFLTPAGEASSWPTGFIATSLHLADCAASALGRAAAALFVSQNEDGGWGYNEEVPSDADSTACVLRFLALMGLHGGGCRRAGCCLASHQSAQSGGIATYAEPGPIRRFMGVGPWMSFRGWCHPHCEVTATAGCALAALGDGWSHEAQAAWRYVGLRQRSDGSWCSYWWSSPHYATLQAVEFAVSLDQHGAASRAGEWAIRCQDDDGGWSVPDAGTSVFATALSLSVLLKTRAHVRPIQRAIDRLAAFQQEDGGWPSHPIMRIPHPGVRDPDGRRSRRLLRLGRGIVIADQHRTFTSAACVAALARARDAIA
jgi:squalene-hopene/tetraprenyl-beta-curcumene cyclase